MKRLYKTLLAHPLAVVPLALILKILLVKTNYEGSDLFVGGLAIWWCARRGDVSTRLVRGLLVAAFLAGVEPLIESMSGTRLMWRLCDSVAAPLGFAISAEYVENPSYASPTLSDHNMLGWVYPLIYPPVMAAFYVMAAISSGLDLGIPLRLYALWRGSRRPSFSGRLLAATITAFLLFTVDWVFIGLYERNILSASVVHGMILRWAREYCVLVPLAIGIGLKTSGG